MFERRIKFPFSANFYGKIDYNSNGRVFYLNIKQYFVVWDTELFLGVQSLTIWTTIAVMALIVSSIIDMIVSWEQNGQYVTRGRKWNIFQYGVRDGK